MEPLLSALALVGGGILALALATESPRDLASWVAHALLSPRRGADERRARAFWEAVARNSILLGALGAAYGLAALLASDEGARGGGGQRFGEVVLGPALLGALAAALAALPANRRMATTFAPAPLPPAPPPARWARLGTAAGYGLLAALLAGLLPSAAGRPGLRPQEVLLHPPAWIAVAAGTIAVALYLGDARRGRSLTLAAGVTTAASAAVGLLVALHGFALSRIQPVASGFVFSLSSAVAGLVILATVSLPLEDRAVASGECERSRLVGYGLPLAVVLLCGALWLIASTPMKQP